MNDEFLMLTAAKILGGSNVATSTAAMMGRQGMDAERLATLLSERGRDLTVGHFHFKLIDADPETPDNFGVFVRRV